MNALMIVVMRKVTAITNFAEILIVRFLSLYFIAFPSLYLFLNLKKINYEIQTMWNDVEEGRRLNIILESKDNKYISGFFVWFFFVRNID